MGITKKGFGLGFKDSGVGILGALSIVNLTIQGSAFTEGLEKQEALVLSRVMVEGLGVRPLFHLLSRSR